MKKSTILCMFSGGIDSSGVLNKLITDTDYYDRELIVHHIYLQNRENRAEAEAQSVQKIIQYYQKHYPERPFTTSSNIFNTNGFASLKANRFPFDMDVCAFVAGNIAVARKDIREVAMGRTLTDVESGGENFKQRMQRAQSVFKSVYSLEQETPPNYIFPVINLTKQEVWRHLPEKVQSEAWYCRHPRYKSDSSAVACQQCITCKQVATFINDQA